VKKLLTPVDLPRFVRGFFMGHDAIARRLAPAHYFTMGWGLVARIGRRMGER
jgi:hypothetical protein